MPSDFGKAPADPATKRPSMAKLFSPAKRCVPPGDAVAAPMPVARLEGFVGA